MTLTADTVEADSAACAYLVISAVFAFLSAIRTDRRTVRASVAAVANLLNTVFTYAAAVAEGSFSARTAFTRSAFNTDFSVGPSLALFSAFRAHVRTFRTPLSAVADLIDAVFTQLTCLTEVFFSTHAVYTV